MKTLSWICVTFGLLASGLSANEDLYLKSRWVDGLPLWLAEAGMAELEVKPGTKDVDLSDGFKKLGCSIPNADTPSQIPMLPVGWPRSNR